MKRRHVDSVALREQAARERSRADDAARAALLDCYDAADALEARADELEFVREVEERRRAVVDEAQEAARLAQLVGEQAARVAEQAAAKSERRAELERQVGNLERDRGEVLAEVIACTAAGRIAEALELEDVASRFDPDPVRAELERVRAAEEATEQRANELQADAAAHAERAGELRAVLDHVADEVRPRYDRRREEREKQRSAALYALDWRREHLVALAAAQCELELLRPPEPIPEVRPMAVGIPDNYIPTIRR